AKLRCCWRVVGTHCRMWRWNLSLLAMASLTGSNRVRTSPGRLYSRGHLGLRWHTFAFIETVGESGLMISESNPSLSRKLTSTHTCRTNRQTPYEAALRSYS